MANEKLDLISRSDLLAKYDRIHVGEPGKARKLIEDAPTVDAVPVVHGRWRMETDEEEPNPFCKVLVCSVCGKMGGRNLYYCPNCGADMRDGGVP